MTEQKTEDTGAEVGLYDTTQAQLFSVHSFMKKLNYTMMKTPKGGFVFVSAVPRSARSTISFNKAVALHNSQFEPVGDYHYATDAPGQTLIADAYTSIQAIAARTVEHVKLQYCKRNKQITLQHPNANLVKWAMPEYAGIFRGELVVEDEVTPVL